MDVQRWPLFSTAARRRRKRSKAGRRDDPTRDADDDAKTYKSIECPACSRVQLVNPARESWQGMGGMATVSGRVHPPVHNTVAKADRGVSATGLHGRNPLQRARKRGLQRPMEK